MSPLVMSTITIIALKYFENNSCWYYFGNVDINLKALSIVTLNKPYNNNTFEILKSIKCNGFLIIGENLLKDVEIIEYNLRYSTVYRFIKRRYLLIEDGNVNVEEYFDTEVFYKIINLLLIVSKNDCLDFYTHRYTGTTPQKTVYIGEACNDADVNKVDLYPQKFENLLQRELKIATFHYLPYVNFDKNNGAEWSIMNSFVDKYNFTKKIVPTNGTSSTLYNNFTGTGAIGLVVSGQADFGIGCYYQMVHRRASLEFSMATLRNALTFLVPKPQLSAGIDVPLKPFQAGPWCMLLATLFTLVLLYTFTNMFYKQYKRKTFGQFLFELYGVLLQQNMNLRFRFLGVLAFCYSLLMAAFFNSVLASIMTKPMYNSAIKTGRDLNNSDVQIFGVTDDYIYSLDEKFYGGIFAKFNGIRPAEFENVIQTTTQLALAIDHLDLGFALSEFNAILYQERLEQFVLLEEDLSYESCTILGVKHSVLIPLLDKHILRLKEAGLDYYWQAESFRNMDNKKHMYLNRFNHEPVQFIQLQRKHVSGAFLMLAIGYLLALLQFFHERYKSTDLISTELNI